MATVNPSQSAPGDTIEAADVNTPVNQLAAQINGNIDSTNLADSAVTASKIATGAVSTAKVFVPAKVDVFLSATQVLSASTATKVLLNSENFDTGNNFDSVTNYRFTAAIQGYYQVSAQVQIGTTGIATTAFALGYIFKNGAEFIRGLQITGSGNGSLIPTSNISRLVFLTPGDYLELFAFCSEARDIVGGNNRTYLSLHLVSQT